jgi:soluble cytochrome b562
MVSTAKIKEVERLTVALEKIRKLAQEGQKVTSAQAYLKQIDDVAKEAIEWIEHRKRNSL